MSQSTRNDLWQVRAEGIQLSWEVFEMAKHPPSGRELQVALSRHLPAHLRDELGREERTEREGAFHTISVQ